MITRLKVRAYRILRNIDISLRPFQILVGPNGSGKSTLLDVFAFLRELITENDLDKVVETRAYSLQDLIWNRELGKFEFEIEVQPQVGNEGKLIYKLLIGFSDNEEACVLEETLRSQSLEKGKRQRLLLASSPLSPFGGPQSARHSEEGYEIVLLRNGKQVGLADVRRPPSTLKEAKEYRLIFPDAPDSAIWLKEFLRNGLVRLHLHPEAMKKPCPPGKPGELLPDGSNIARVIKDFKKKRPKRFKQWLAHLQTIVPEIRNIAVKTRPEDRSDIIYVEHPNVSIPSWNISDGTLRAIALTIIAYLSDTKDEFKTYLIDEPENGIHPKVLEGVYQSLSSAYNCQIICATHSPVLVALAKPEELLCMTRNKQGAAKVIRGEEHFALQDWQEGVDIGKLFAAGVLE
ncbi:MAG TPA: ATP-binding cassette domain-containing protein [Proteobacteria bacterium]|nr:ATP-binding cassette domain-containing protein [Pseudomonadota bacterium]